MPRYRTNVPKNIEWVNGTKISLGTNMLSKYRTNVVTALRKVVASSDLIVYHGSDKKITEFKKGIKSARFLLFKAFDVESQGAFFAFDPEVTKEYGVFTHKVTITDPNLFIRTDEEHAGVDRLDKKRERELAEMLQATAKNNVINLYEFDLFIPEDFDSSEEDTGSQPSPNWAWIYEAVGSGGIVWDLLDEPAFVKKMEQFGYDGTLVEESSEHGGKSLFLSNLSKINDVELLKDEEDEEDEEDDLDN